MKKEIHEKAPFGYGYAWDNYESGTVEVYFVPLNIILRQLRKIWFFLSGRRKDKLNEAFRKDFKLGREYEAKMGFSNMKKEKEFTQSEEYDKQVGRLIEKNRRK